MAKRTRYAEYQDRYANPTFELPPPRAETYAQRQFFPMGGGMRGLDRPWDQGPWSD